MDNEIFFWVALGTLIALLIWGATFFKDAAISLWLWFIGEGG